LDTKLRSRFGILVWLMLFTYGISGVLIALTNERDYIKQNYFKTSQFERHIQQLFDYIYLFEIAYQTKDQLRNSLTVTKDEIEEYRNEYRNIYGVPSEQIRSIEQEYESRIQEARAGGDQNTTNVLIKERDKKIEEITKVFESDDYVKEIILKRKTEKIDAYYEELEHYRPEYEQYKNTFDYYLKNTKTGEVYTDLPIEDRPSAGEYFSEKNMRTVISFPTDYHSYLKPREHPVLSGGYEDVKNQLNADFDTLYEGRVGISKNIPDSNFIMREYNDFKFYRIVFWIYTIGSVIALAASWAFERRRKVLRSLKPGKWQNIFNKIPIDVALSLFGITAIITISLFFEYPFLGYSNQIAGIIEGILYHILVLALLFWLSIVQGVCLYSRLKDLSSIQKNWKDAWLVKFIKMIRNAFLNRKVGTQVFILLTIIFLFGVGTAVIFIEDDFLALYIPAFFLVGIPMLVMIIKRIGYFNKIINYAGLLANGYFEPDLEVKGKSVLAKLAEDINKMKYGVRSSQKAQAKSERLKTELITNVSHDLRTPLTSIMTYVELLKNPGLTEDERDSYIEIIDRKSKRLKVLIDDLFEASKMASGNIELVKEKIDIVQLLHQALAEYNEAIKESSIQFRISTPDQPVYTFVDGQKLWRVFDNLINNILKYSLKNTRAYINVHTEDGHVIITFKNISEYELRDNVDELFERFKRGDESRHTEGSGLGLAIAKSIMDLHDGSIDIDVDGDLFKVTVKLKLFRT